MPTTRTRMTAMAATVLAGLMTAAAHASSIPAPGPRIDLASGSRLTLKGKSTMHDYASTATRLDLSVEIADELPAGPSTLSRLSVPGAVKSIVLTIPVAAMKSEKDGLDKNMRKALKADANPNIVLRLHAATPVAGPTFRAEGELEVAGVRQPVEVLVRASETPEGIVLEGNKALRMSEYGIKPPSMFLGTLKTDDRVEIEWRLVLTSTGF